MKITPTRFIIYSTVAMLAVASSHIRADLTPAQKAEIITRFQTEVKYNFAHYDRTGKEFDSICHARLTEIVNTSTDEEFQNEFLLLVNTLRDGHTALSWSADVATAPFLQKRFGDRVFVTEVFSDEYTAKGVTRGTEILEIDGVPVIEYGETKVAPFIPSSTEQWSAAYPFNSVNLTKGKRSEPVTFTFRNKKGKPFKVTDDRQSPWNTVKPSTEFTLTKLKGNIGLLRFPTFRADGFDAQKFIDMYEKEILPLAGLIIDVRDNTGGNSGIGQFVMQLIANDTIPFGRWTTPKYRAAYASWGQTMETDTIPIPDVVPYCLSQPDVPSLNIPVALLVNSTTFSASEDFTALFKDAKRGPIIGTPTGGSTGNPIVVNLGYGYWGRITTINETLADGTEFIGIGIQPDIYVEETPDVLTGGTDPVLETALTYLRSHKP